jgi:hypothetical protein
VITDEVRRLGTQPAAVGTHGYDGFAAEYGLHTPGLPRATGHRVDSVSLPLIGNEVTWAESRFGGLSFFFFFFSFRAVRGLRSS